MSAHRSQLFFRRGDVLYSATVDEKSVGKPRLLAHTSAISTKGDEPVWAVSPDARQIVYKGPVPAAIRKNERYVSLQAVHIATLPKTAVTKMESRLLFCTVDLRDIHGRKVTMFPAFARLPHQDKHYPLPDEEIDSGWQIKSLRWSNRSDYLYVSLSWGNTLGGYATCAVDARTGKAITDASGNWKRLLPTFNIDESQDGLLVGCGLGRTYDEPKVCNACSRYEPLYVASRIRKLPINLLPGRFNSKNRPEYAFAERCAIAPAGERIAFVSNNQLWITSADASRYARLLTPPHADLYLGGIAWLAEDALIYHQYKFIGPAGRGRMIGDVWHLPIAADGRVTAKPSLFLDNVEEFMFLPR